jgi:hypothetical protein
MTSATRRRLGALMLAAILFPAAANGQRTPSTPAPVLSFDEMALRVNVGATVIVADTSGRRFSGRLTALSSETLSMLTGGRAVTFRESQVREVQQRLRDSKRDGAAIGFLAGWLVPAAICASRSDSSETSACVLDTLLLGGLPGMAIGAAVDAAHAKTVTVFRSADSARLAMAPIVSRRRLGVQAFMQLGR